MSSERLVNGEHGELVDAENSRHVRIQVDVSLVGGVLEVMALDIRPHLRDNLKYVHKNDLKNTLSR